MLNIHIALAETPPEHGVLWVGRRSHLSGVLPNRENDSFAKGHREALSPPIDPVQMTTMFPGDALIFDRECLHKSSVNSTDGPRFAYAAQFMAEDTRLASTGERVPGKLLATDLQQLVRQRQQQQQRSSGVVGRL